MLCCSCVQLTSPMSCVRLLGEENMDLTKFSMEKVALRASEERREAVLVQRRQTVLQSLLSGLCLQELQLSSVGVGNSHSTSRAQPDITGFGWTVSCRRLLFKSLLLFQRCSSCADLRVFCQVSAQVTP